MATAENKGQLAGAQAVTDPFGQFQMGLLQVVTQADHIASIVERTICSPGQVGQGAAQPVWTLACADAASVAAHPFIAAEADQGQSIALLFVNRRQRLHNLMQAVAQLGWLFGIDAAGP